MVSPPYYYTILKRVENSAITTIITKNPITPYKVTSWDKIGTVKHYKKWVITFTKPF